MSVEVPLPPTLLVLATAAGPHEVSAAAATAANRFRGVFSSDVREEAASGHGIDVLGEERCSSARAERAHRAAEGFTEVLTRLLAR